MTLADEDTKSILTENANRAIQGNLAMQVAPCGGHICNYCKRRHLMAKFGTNVSGAILLPSSIQVTEPISGSIVPLAMFSLWTIHVLYFCKALGRRTSKTMFPGV